MTIASMAETSNDYTRAEAAARYILAKTKLRPRIALVLGSGLGGFADSLCDAVAIDYREIPNYPSATAIGHAGRLVIGNCAGIPLTVMQGRVHFYEGLSMKDVVFPIRVFGRMGVAAALLTNAAGGINREYNQGALVALSDHINLQGPGPLVGPGHPGRGPVIPSRPRRPVRSTCPALSARPHRAPPAGGGPAAGAVPQT